MTHASIIIGVDESGAGALAGPLVVCAAAFRREDSPVTASFTDKRGRLKTLVAGDSKKFTNEIHRQVLDVAIRNTALGVMVIERTNKDIDTRLFSKVFPEALGTAATRLIELLMSKGLSRDPHEYLVLYDGKVPAPRDLPCETRTIVDGDKRVWQIGAASIVAKVACDAQMAALHTRYPRYDFIQNRGYPTRIHKALLKEYGACDAHRRTFRPVAFAQGARAGFEE